jgi:hypothetical protein
MLVVPLVALSGFTGERSMYHRKPTNASGRFRRAGVITAAAGLGTMPWLFWSGVPEIAIVDGVALTVVGAQRLATSSARP